MRVETFPDGFAIQGDSTSPEVRTRVKDLAGPFPLILTDPPYGNIVEEDWDAATDTASFVAWMLDWTNVWSEQLEPNGAFYIWGGIGRPEFRPFFQFLSEVENKTSLKIANLITWGKKRAYGVQHNYLFTREECAYLIKGDDIKKPRCFNVPLLEELRGYDGYDPKHPAKSPYKRRTNVWTDVTEILRGKIHPTQKAQRIIEIPIEVHTRVGEWVLDPFAGYGTTAFAARKLKRKFVVIERDGHYFEAIIKRLQGDGPEPYLYTGEE